MSDPPTPQAGPPGHRPPSDYRPDLRPMIILGLLLLAVVVAWILISPLILPGR